MKILFVVPYVPSLVRVRPYNFVRHLSARGHQVTVATLWTSERERREADELRSSCHRVVGFALPSWRSLASCAGALATDDPLQARYSASPALDACVAELSHDADVVHIEHLRGARTVAAVAPGTPVVWDSVDCISKLFAQALDRRRDVVGRWITRIELSRTRRFEAQAIQRFDHVVVSSALDRASLLELSHAGDDAISVVTNGVDLSYFAPGAEVRQPETIVFSGKMSYHANESAVLYLIRDVMPLIWQRRPSAQLVVAGKDPSRALRTAAGAAGPRVTITGTVADMRPHLGTAAVAAVPLVYGAGCQNKVLEAMACATPVVATSQAVSALRAQNGADVLVADGARPFADAVLNLIENPRRQREVGDAGRRYVETHHQWDRIAQRLESVYEQVVAARLRPAHVQARLSA